MRKLVAMAALLLLAVAVPGLAEETKGKTHEMTGMIVSLDTEGKTVTIKSGEEEMTLPLLEKVMASLGEFKKGDHVTVTCMDDADGEHQGIVQMTAVSG